MGIFPRRDFSPWEYFLHGKYPERNLFNYFAYIHIYIVYGMDPTQLLHVVVNLVGFVALRPTSTAMVIAGRLVHLTTLFPGQA